VDSALSPHPAAEPALCKRSKGISQRLRLDRSIGVAALVAIWGLAVDHLRVEWSINEQYSYGWLAPWLALYLFALRWKTRPTPKRARQNGSTFAVLSLIALALLPTRLLQVSSPDWRLIGWVLSTLAVVFTLGVIYLHGGSSWLRHFFFPIVFTLVAVPWPVPFEQSVVQSLMRVVAGASVEALRWCGFPAIQQGNIIKLGLTGSVGLEEACSGVRSMQTMLMTSLFFGEIWHKGILRRFVLVVVGVAIGFLFNVGRAFTLSWLTAKRGSNFAHIWHDRVGMLVVALTIVTFALLAYAFRNRKADEDTTSVEMRQNVRCGVSWRWSAALLGWLVLIWVGTELWYRGAERGASRSELVINWPVNELHFHDLEISKRTGIILRHDEGRCATWQNDGDTWAMVYLRWRPGSAAVQLARAHTPDICLPAAGGRLEADHGVIVVPAGDLTIPAHAYTFAANGQRIHVFYIRTGDDAGSSRLPVDIEELTVANRIEAALARRRNRGQQVIEVAVTSPKPLDEVTLAFGRFGRETFAISETSN
jgi:exosortase